ncbi:TolC family protein [Bradyrhizobium betae]
MRADTARANNRAAGEVLQAVITQQTSAVEQAFYEALVSQERVAVLTETLALYGRTQQANESRLKAGDVSRADVSKLQLDVMRAQTDMRSAMADHASDKARAGAGDRRARHAGQQPPGGRLACPRCAGAGTRCRYRAAPPRRDRGRGPPGRRRQRAIWPAPAACPTSPLARRLSTYPTSPSNQTGSGNSFGVFVSIPLYVRHSFGGEARRAEVDYYAALDDRNRVLLEAQNELERSRNQLEAARLSLKQMMEGVVPTAESVAGSAEFAYSKGASGDRLTCSIPRRGAAPDAPGCRHCPRRIRQIPGGLSRRPAVLTQFPGSYRCTASLIPVSAPMSVSMTATPASISPARATARHGVAARLAAFSLVALALAACGKQEAPPPNDEPKVSGNTIEFPATVRTLPGISGQGRQERRRAHAEPARPPGNGTSDRTVRVTTPFAGRVTEVLVQPGSNVKAGQSLATLTSTDFGIAQADARKAAADSAYAGKALARQRELYNAGIVAQKELEQTQADAARASADLQRTQAALRQYGSRCAGRGREQPLCLAHAH